MIILRIETQTCKVEADLGSLKGIPIHYLQLRMVHFSGLGRHQNPLNEGGCHGDLGVRVQ